MKLLYDYIIKPLGERYSNSIEIEGDKSLILNTEVFNHGYINRRAIVVSIPIDNIHNLREGQEILVHHNIFRR